MAKGGLFSFLRRGREREFVAAVEAVTARLITGALGRAGLGGASGQPREVDAAGLAAGADSGTLTAFFHDGDAPDLIILMPGARPADFAGTADFLCPRDGRRPAGRLCCTRAFGPEDRDDLLWQASAGRCFRLPLGPASESAAPEAPALFFVVEEGAAARTSEAFESDPEYAREVRSMVEARESPQPEGEHSAMLPAPAAMDVLRPLELAGAGLLLPLRVKCGRHVLEPRVRHMAAAPAGASWPEAPGIWVRGTFTLGSRACRIWYFFPARSQEAAERGRETFKAMAGCLLRSSMEALAAALAVPAGGATMAVGARPTPEAGPERLHLKAVLRMGTARLALEMAVEPGALDAARQALHPGAAPAGGVLAALLCISQDMLARKRESMFRSLAGGPQAALPFSLFLELVTERDRAVVIQNRLLQTLGVRGLLSLLDPGQAPAPFFFETERLLPYLPAQARAQWEQEAGGDPTGAEDHSELERRTLEDLFTAARRRGLGLSPRAVFILDRLAMPDIRARTRADLEETRAQGVPFKTLKGLPRPRLQHLLAGLGNRTLALALVEAEQERGLVAANISSRRRPLLEQDVPAARKALQAGDLEPREVLEAKREVEAAARRLIEQDRQAREREALKRSGGGRGKGKTRDSSGSADNR
jgi:hypothetical protein